MSVNSETVHPGGTSFMNNRLLTIVELTNLRIVITNVIVNKVKNDSKPLPAVGREGFALSIR